MDAERPVCAPAALPSDSLDTEWPAHASTAALSDSAVANEREATCRWPSASVDLLPRRQALGVDVLEFLNAPVMVAIEFGSAF